MNLLDFIIESLVSIPPPTVLSQQILPWISKHGIITSQAFMDYLHTAIYVAIFYQFCFVIASYIIFPPLTSLIDAQHRTKLINQSAVHFVSLVQSIIVLRLSFDCLLSEEYHTRFSNPWLRVFGMDQASMTVCTFAAGYFLWDIYISVVHSTFPFVVHAIVSMTVFCIGMKPYIAPYGCVFLMFELSNPFLNIRWFALKYLTGANSSKFSKWAQLVNNICLLVVFFLARIVWGWYQAGRLAYDFWLVRNDPRFLPWESLTILLGNFILDILNVIWFSTMCKVAGNVVRGKPN